MPRPNSVALFPCTQILFEARSIPLSRLQEVWDKTTVYVMRNCDTERIVFATSMGRLHSDKFAVGTQHPVHHDQSQAFYGVFRVENIIDAEGGLIMQSENDVGLDKKAPCWVFK